jgi:hypothetical protein
MFGFLSIHFFHTNILYRKRVKRRGFECFFVVEDAVVVVSDLSVEEDFFVFGDLTSKSNYKFLVELKNLSKKLPECDFIYFHTLKRPQLMVFLICHISTRLK